MSARLTSQQTRLRARRNARRDAASRLDNGLGRRGVAQPRRDEAAAAAQRALHIELRATRQRAPGWGREQDVA